MFGKKKQISISFLGGRICPWLHCLGRGVDGSLIPPVKIVNLNEWFIVGGPICLVGQGYNMPRKRGSKPISQNYPPGGDGGGVVEDIFVLLLYSMEKVQRVRCKILEEQCFQCEHPEGTLWPANIQRAVKYPGIGIPISAIEKWRNVATGAFCIVTDGSAGGLNRGKRMRGGGTITPPY